MDVVIDAIWPDIAPDLGRERLRTVLARVPHCPQRLLVRHGDTLALAPDVLLDAADFEAAARRALMARARGDGSWVAMAGEALDSYGGDLFAGRSGELWPLGRVNGSGGGTSRSWTPWPEKRPVAGTGRGA